MKSRPGKLCLLPLVFLIFSCSNTGDNIEKLTISSPGEFPIVEEPVTFEFLVDKQIGTITDWNTNSASIFLETLTGVHIEYRAVPDMSQSLQLAIASGSLPDVVMSPISTTEVMKYGPEGVFIPLNSLIEEHASNIQANFESDPYFHSLVTAPDGNIYGLPSVNDNLLGAAAGGYWGIFSENGGESGRFREFDLLPPLLGPEGVQTTGYHYVAYLNTFLVTSGCEYPEVAVKWADYIASPEGAYNTQFGIEGNGWIRPPDGAVGLNGKPALFIRLRPHDVNVNWGFAGGPPRYQPVDQRLGEMVAPPEDYYNPSKLMTRLISEVMEKYVPYKPDENSILPPLYISEESNKELAVIEEDIDVLVRDMTVKFCVGVLDINNDTDWNNYLKALDNAGLPRLIEIYQEVWDTRYSS